MQSPRATAASRAAAPTMMQPAFDAASCGRYFGLERKPSAPGPAASSGSISPIARFSSPCRSPPRARTMVPRRCGTLRLLRRRGRRVERADHLVGDVVLGVDVDGFLQDDVVLFLFGDLLDHAVRAVED